MPIAIGNENALSCDSSTTFISSHLVSFCFIPRSVCREDFLSPSYTRVWDSYEKGKNLGSGAFGTVVIGVSRDTSRQEHAIKIIPKSKVRNIKALEREIAIMKRLDHESIIKLHSAFEDEKNVFLAMDLCKGGELYDRICKMEYLSEKEASFYVKQILEALEYCHGEGIVHRDLKPENFMLKSKVRCSGRFKEMLGVVMSFQHSRTSLCYLSRMLSSYPAV